MRENFDENAPNFTSNLPVPALKLLDCFLRVSVIPLSIATIWLTVTNKQDNISYGKIEYMVCISTISAAYVFLATMASWIRCLVTKAWLFFVSDQIVAYLMLTSGAAVMEIQSLASNGDRTVSWSEACSSYGRFCSRMKVALVLHALALCSFIVLAVISAYRVFSMFEPPASHREVDEERI
ncbi:hypothetical protein GBA52_014366 [Prunus armeniaca]|nr:hypothetical protein GBA52_014147 [Prunus armeniaca]KAH0987189.1 hypothetical protein GBA52_014366 [Prunus armeniaca]